jgi:hypothetical protein
MLFNGWHRMSETPTSRSNASGATALRHRDIDQKEDGAADGKESQRRQQRAGIFAGIAGDASHHQNVGPQSGERHDDLRSRHHGGEESELRLSHVAGHDDERHRAEHQARAVSDRHDGRAAGYL